jgi:hypothetical protein
MDEATRGLRLETQGLPWEKIFTQEKKFSFVMSPAAWWDSKVAEKTLSPGDGNLPHELL